MNRLDFDDKLFQRGRTWEECLESWSHQRQDFLERVALANPLAQTAHYLNGQPRNTRFAVYYSMHHLDTRLTLPYLGTTFATAAQLEIRYFCAEFFFPVLGHGFGRHTPRLAKVHVNGHLIGMWGPRPDTLEASFQAAELLPGTTQDQWLLALNQEKFRTDLDQAVHQFLTQTSSP